MKRPVSPDNSFGAGLSDDALRRLVISLVSHAQKRLEKKGLIRMDQALSALILDKSPTEIDAIEITEDQLGFDSLGILDLILTMNRFFELSRSGVEDYLLVHRRIGDWISLLSKHREIVGEEWSFGFETSGSTGDARVTSHTAASLWAEMRAQVSGPFSHMGPPGQVITLVPPHHIYGFLFSGVLPDLLGLKVLDLHYAAPTSVFRHACAGDLIVGTPLHWNMLGTTNLQFADGVFGVTSAGPSKKRTWDVVSCNNLERLTEIYGATETGGIGSRTDHESPFTLLSHLDYAGAQIVQRDGGAKLHLQDKLDWIQKHSFQVCGRLDHAVQVAGVNVSPSHVKTVLSQLDGVQSATVRFKNERLHAFIIPQKGVDEIHLRRCLQNHIADTLEAVARPASLTFGTCLPQNEMGKPIDWAD